jgi:hypothetical protein
LVFSWSDCRIGMDKVEPINLISQGLTTTVRAAKFEINSIIAALVPALLLNIPKRQQTGAGVTHKRLNEHLRDKGLSFRWIRIAWKRVIPRTLRQPSKSSWSTVMATGRANKRFAGTQYLYLAGQLKNAPNESTYHPVCVR